MVILDGYAADTTEGGEVIYPSPTYKFSWEKEPEPAKPQKPAKPGKAKREDFQMQLF